MSEALNACKELGSIDKRIEDMARERDECVSKVIRLLSDEFYGFSSGAANELAREAYWSSSTKGLSEGVKRAYDGVFGKYPVITPKNFGFKCNRCGHEFDDRGSAGCPATP